MQNMEVEISRLQDTARSNVVASTLAAPETQSLTTQWSVTVAAAAAAAARRSTSPPKAGGSKSAWGEEIASEGKSGPEAADTAKSTDTKKVMEKYSRMRKMGIPDGAIRHKMKQDGMEAADIAWFFSTPAAELKVLTNTDSVSTEAASSNSSKVGLEKYSKMKKL